MKMRDSFRIAANLNLSHITASQRQEIKRFRLKSLLN